MPRDAAHHSVYRTSDFIVLLALGVGTLVERVFFWYWSLPISAALRIAVGLPVAIAGVALVVAARVTLARANQPSGPGLPTTRIVSSGIFRYPRNPACLGLGVVMLGAASR